MARKKNLGSNRFQQHALTPIEREFLKSASTKRTVRINGKSVELTQEAIAVSTLFKNSLDGSIQGMGQYLHYTKSAQEKHEAEIDQVKENAGDLKREQRKRFREAKSKNRETRLILPHPDDIIIDDIVGYKILGPWNEEELLKVEKAVRRRDVMNVQAALERRFEWPIPPKTALDPEGRFWGGSAEFMADSMNTDLPTRFRMSDAEIWVLHRRLDLKTKRALLREAHTGWRSLGEIKPRGWLTVPLFLAAPVLATVHDAARRVVGHINEGDVKAASNELESFRDGAAKAFRLNERRCL